MADSQQLDLLFNGRAAWNEWRGLNPGAVIDLRGADLSSRDFSDFNFAHALLQEANFSRSTLRGATFISANLSRTNLSHADLARANLIAATLIETDLSYAQLDDTRLLTAVLRRVDLSHVDLRGLDLQSLDLRGTDLTGANLADQNLQQQDLSGATLVGADLRHANLGRANLSKANLDQAELAGAILAQANLQDSMLNGADLSGQDLSGARLRGAQLTSCDLRGANLTNAELDRADLTGSRLAKLVTQGWSIKGITCKYAFWDKEGERKTNYGKGEFERMYSEAIKIELRYDRRLSATDLATLPFLIEHLEASHWGCLLRLKSIEEVAGGSVVTLAVEEVGSHTPSVLAQQLNDQVGDLLHAQNSLREDKALQLSLKESLSEIKNEIWPRLLELAAEHKDSQARHLTVLFMDLKNFTHWDDREISENLALFRGLIKPVLQKWGAGHPNMEGDSLRATFQNARTGLECACMLQQVLAGAGFALRIGLDLGPVRTSYNEVTEETDLEGHTVNFAARLESLAQPGQVLVSESVWHFTEKHHGEFQFTPLKLRLDKDVGKLRAGDDVLCYGVSR
ncbi:MAG: pentapeptide repeat-containing protein [Gammaproteobacteria bacterium]|nr:pentapeptide repeat-containing protein [Gammaproteobacteria bacterium]